MAVKQLLQQATTQLAVITETPDLEARMLLSYTLDQTDSWLFAWPEHQPTPDQQVCFEQLLQQRLRGKPIAHLLKQRAFWSLDLKVTEDVLIPRPDTEILVDTLLKLRTDDTQLQVLDVGTGSGAIALALASERRHWTIHAADVSAQALAVARDNAAKHQLNAIFHLSNWFDAIPAALRFDIIVSNPPYICDDDPHLAQGDVRFEPQLALTSGPDGLDAIRHLIQTAPAHLKTGGVLLLEHGYNQAADVRQLFETNGFTDIITSIDHGGNDRATYAIVSTS